MDELKTLKDFEFINQYIDDEELLKKQSDTWKNELRANAIKWVKHWRKDPNEWLGESDFMDFFNLTEEDLKEEEYHDLHEGMSGEDVLAYEGRI